MANYGWAGSILRVNLTNGSISKISTDPYKEYIGGMGIGYKIIWDEVPLETHPYAPEAKVVFAVGPLTASGVPCSGRTNVSFLTNFTRGQSICDGHMGGHFAQYMKFAGYDAIILEGASENPVYLKIDDDRVSIEPASHLWGKGTFETNKWLIESAGPDFSSVAIGPAGENLVNYSIVHTSQGNAAGAGSGAVLGAKKLKGIVVRGTGSVKIADPERLLELSHYQLSELIGAQNNHIVPTTPQSWAEFSAQPPNRWRGAPGHVWGRAPGGPVDVGEQPAGDINRISYRAFNGLRDFPQIPGRDHSLRDPMQYTVKYGGCSYCPVRCYAKYDYHPLAEIGENPKFTNVCVVVRFGVENWYLGNPPDIAVEGDAPMLIGGIACKIGDDLGIWDNYLTLAREFRYCYEFGVFERVIPREEYNEIPWHWMHEGDPRWIRWMLESIAYKRGEISHLGDGTYNIAKRWNLPDHFWDDGFMNLVTRNGYRAHHCNSDGMQAGLLFNLMYNRDCMTHAISNFSLNGAPFRVIREVAESFFGEGCIDPPMNYNPINESKIRIAKWGFLSKQWHDMSTVCDWVWPMTMSPLAERGYRGDLDIEGKFMTAMTGQQWSTKDVDFACEKVSNMLRVMTAISFKIHENSSNLRQDHDIINDHFFDRNPDIPVFTEGTNKMDRADMELAKNMFYTAMGWDVATGIPTRSTLAHFGLEDMADALERYGILPPDNPGVIPMSKIRVG